MGVESQPKEGAKIRQDPEYNKNDLFERMKTTKLIQINYDITTSIKVKKEVGFFNFMNSLRETAYGLAKFLKPLSITVDF